MTTLASSLRAAGSRSQMALLAILVVCVYANSLDNAFQFDDEHSIVQNEHLRSLSAIPAFFVDPATFSNDPAMSMYRPVLQTTLAINYAFGDLNPVGYRALNVGLHVLVCALVALLATHWTARATAAWWAAALFAVHPVNSQIINYVSSRSGLLAALATTAAVYLMGRPHPRPAAAAVVHLAGLLSKSTALALLPLVALHEWGTQRRWRLVAVFTFTCATYLVLASSTGFLTGSVRSLVRPLAVQVLTQLKALVYYVYLIFVPARLSVAHALDEALTASTTVAVALGLCASVIALALRAWRPGRPTSASTRWLGFGVLWFFLGFGVTFAMPLNVVVSEQRTYLSMIGLALAAAFLVPGRVRLHPTWLAVALVVLATLTWQRNAVWEDKLSLWTNAAHRALPSDPQLADRLPPFVREQWAMVQVNLGEAYYELGDTARSHAAYRSSLAYDPEHPSAWNNVGVLHEEGHRAAEAERAYRAALYFEPDWYQARANLGRLLLNAGRDAEARALLSQAVAGKPRAGVLVHLGIAAHRGGDGAAAMRHFQEALGLEPDHVDAVVNLGNLRQEAGLAANSGEARNRLLQQAEDHYLHALELDKDHPEALLNAAGLASVLGRDEASWDLYRRAVAVAPGNAAARGGYGSFLLARGRPQEAEVELSQAVQLDDQTAAVWAELGSAQAQQGQMAEAAGSLRRACRLDSTQLIPLYHLGEVLVHLGDTAAARGEVAVAAASWREAEQCFARVEVLTPDYRGTRARLEQLKGRRP